LKSKGYIINEKRLRNRKSRSILVLQIKNEGGADEGDDKAIGFRAFIRL
jgi:hypothetical protein